MSFQVHNIRYM